MSRQTPEQAARDKIQVGRISGIYGVRGWLKILSWTRPLENILTYSPWWFDVEGHFSELSPEQGQWQGKHLVVKLSGINDRDQAREFLDKDIWIDKSQLPELDEGRYYWHQVVGLDVIDQTGKSLGSVREIQETGANDVIIVEGEKRILIPWVDAFVIDIDLQAGKMKVHWDGEQ